MNPVLLYTLIIAGTFVGALASYFFKNATTNLNSVFDLIKSKSIWIGGILYLIAAANNVFVLRYMDYSVILPLASITYIFTMILANRLLGERITRRKIGGLVCVVAGAMLLAHG
ncbi:MAG: EamA family transporter [Clostridiales bacterium]|nr:EamA family transporter [Clostridiales bacterium]